MKVLLKIASWFMAFFLFWCGVAVLLPEWKMFPFDLLVLVMNTLDFGIHEMGHMVFGISRNEFLGVIGGSLLQWLAPLVMMAYSIYKRQLSSAVLFLFWFGQSLVHSAPYIADARSQSLPLLSPFFFTGEPITHDWYYLLGKVNLLWADKLVSQLFVLSGSLFMLASVVLLVIPFEKTAAWGNRMLIRARRME